MISGYVFDYFSFLSHISDIQIWPVRPLPDINSDFLESDVPMNVRNFYKVNQVDIFQLDRPYHVGTKDDNNEFKVLNYNNSDGDDDDDDD